jgi:ABC-2 type transport system ATP-binding protein
MTAFIGANGAGKSTTLRLLSGVLTPTRGEAWICGERSGTPEAAMRFGFVSGNRSLLWSHMTVRQSLEIIGASYGLRAAERRERIALLARELELETFLGRRGGTLSLGERMRCGMAAAVLHRPAVLLADEPTLGLDIPSRWALRELLRGWTRSSGTTLLLTSHDVGDIESLCERTLLIARGQLVFDGPTADLRASSPSLEESLARYMGEPG